MPSTVVAVVMVAYYEQEVAAAEMISYLKKMPTLAHCLMAALYTNAVYNSVDFEVFFDYLKANFMHNK